MRNNHWRAQGVKQPAPDKPWSSLCPGNLLVMDARSGRNEHVGLTGLRASSLLLHSSEVFCRAQSLPEQAEGMDARQEMLYKADVRAEAVAIVETHAPPRAGCEKQKPFSFVLRAAVC